MIYDFITIVHGKYRYDVGQPVLRGEKVKYDIMLLYM
jgi:hypothetical protein